MISFFIGLAFGFAAMGAFFEKRYMRAVALFLLGICVPLSLSMVAANADSRLALSKLKATSVRIDIGSGFIAKGSSGKKYMVTNWHVCNGGRWKGDMISRFESGVMNRGKIIKESVRCDLCASETDQNFPALDMAPQLTPKEPIYTRGYPNGILTESEGVMRGASIWTYFFPIEALGECIQGTVPVRSPVDGKLIGCNKTQRSYLTSLYVRPGSSGSAVVNGAGNLVGVVSDFHPLNSHEGGIVPYDCLRDFLKGL